MGSTLAEDLHISRYGLSQIYTSKNPLVDIVLVHGLNGDPHDSWTSKKTKCFWPVDLLPADLEDQRVRILTYGYDADVTTFTDGAGKSKLHVHAENLVARLAANRNRKKALERPIIFVCHSLGGLVVKRALIYGRSLAHRHVEHLRSVYVSTYGILFLGTPHNGSDIAKWATMLQSICTFALPKKFFDSSPQLVETLKSNNETLQNINRLFSDFLERFHIYFFHEGKPMDLKGTRQFIVDEESAAPTINGVERMGIEADHSGMCKFDSENSPGYESVFDAIQRYADDGPSIIARRWVEELEARRIERNNEINRLQRRGEEETPEPRDHGNAAPENNGPLLIAPPGFHPNYTFCGMKMELEQLHMRLRNEKNRAVGCAAVLVHGGPGAGKSHLAREYVFQHRDSYPGGVFWIDAKSKESRSKCFWDIAQAASLLGGSESADPGLHTTGSYVGTVRKWFESHQEWLLVFDGISFDQDDEINDFRPLLPYSRNSSIIYTSVDKTLGRKQRLYEPFALKVKPLDVPDACALLFKDLGIENPTTKQTRKAEELVDYFECLPLAIHAIGHRLNAADKPIERYHVNSHPTDLKLAEPYLGIMTDLRQYGHTEALNLITILSFFGHNVPVTMIHLGRKALVDFNVEIKSTDRQGYSPRYLDTTFAALIKYGLIERSMDPYPLNDKASSLRSDSLVVIDKDEAPGLSDSHTESSQASSSRNNQIDVIKIHTVVQGFCRDELKANNPRLLYQWLTLAVKVFCLSYDNAHGRIKSTKTKGLVRDYREYETHAVRLMEHFPDLRKDIGNLQRVHLELNDALENIREEIEDNSLTSSQESFRKQKSVFDRSSSSSSAPDTPITGQSRHSTWDVDMGNHTQSPTDYTMPRTIPGPAPGKPIVLLPQDGYSIEDLGYDSGREDGTTAQPSPSMSQITEKPPSETGQTDDEGWRQVTGKHKPKKKSRLKFVSSLMGKMRKKDLGELRPVASASDIPAKESWKLSRYSLRSKQTPLKIESGQSSANRLSPAISHDGELKKVKSLPSDKVNPPTYANVAAPPHQSGCLRLRASPSQGFQRPQSIAIGSNFSKESLRSRSSNAQSSKMSRSFRSEPGVPFPPIPHDIDPNSAPVTRLHSRMPSGARSDQGEAVPSHPGYSPTITFGQNVPPIPYDANVSITRPSGAKRETLGLGLVQIVPGGPRQPQPAGYSSQPMSRDPSGQSDPSFNSDPDRYSSRISPISSLGDNDVNKPPYHTSHRPHSVGAAQMGAWTNHLNLNNFVPDEAASVMSRESSGPGFLVDLGSGQGQGIVGFGQVPQQNELKFGDLDPFNVEEARQRTVEYERRLAFEQGQFRRQRGPPRPIPYPDLNLIPTDSDQDQLQSLLSGSEITTRGNDPENGGRAPGRHRSGSYPARPMSNGKAW